MARTSKRRFLLRVATGAAAVIVFGGAVAAAAPDVRVGPRSDGTAITPVGYRVTPAGQQTNLGDLPLVLRLSPDGKTLLVSNDGQGQQSIQVVDASSSKVTQTIPYSAPNALFAGLAFSPDGGTAYASGGGSEKIHVYQVANGQLSEHAPIVLPATNPAGAKVNMFPAGLEPTPDGKRLVVADHLADAVSVIDLTSGAISTAAVGHTPFGVAVSADGSTAYVTNQGDTTVSVVDLATPTPTIKDTVQVGTHPNAAVLDKSGQTLYVANGDSDQISVVDTSTDKVATTIDLAPYDKATVGTNPTGLSLSPDGDTLYVANSGNNDVDVIDLHGHRVVGSIPNGWYSSAVVATESKLYVTSAKGLGAGPNNGPGYPNPTSTTPQSPSQYVGSMMVGTLSTLSLPLRGGKLSRYTDQVAANDGFNQDQNGDTGHGPIKHVIYVVKENRTYDQEFGSLGKGNGDPSLNLFGDESATTARALQRRFVTLDNFYADAEVSAQGWNWAVASNSNPFSEALWPANYSGRNAPYPSESSDPAIAPNKTPGDAYVWDRLGAAGVSFRNYGFYVSADPSGQQLAGDPVLNANTDHSYHGYDLNCPENPDTFTPRATNCGTARITEWLKEFNQYTARKTLPTVEFIRLPNDHTAGTRPGMPTPRAYVADNDLAVGKLVDAVSHSSYWKDTAIFVTEDDAQNGPDHVDAHRTIASVISPYTQTGKVDSTMYSTVSILRTIENIVGIRPLTQFDTYATPMVNAFSEQPDTAPYTAVRPAEAGNNTNGVNAPMAAQSAAQRLDKEDQINMDLFNRAIWASVKGTASTMPAPRHNLWGAVANPTDG
jgi:YVTN family beta-propeller protein